MLSRSIGRYLSWPINRLAGLLAPTRVPPNVITWAALGLNLWAGTSGQTVVIDAGRIFH